MPELEDCSDDEGGNMLTPMDGKSFIARQAFNTQLKGEDGDEQREDIFHTRCMVKDRICTLSLMVGVIQMWLAPS